MSGNDRSSLHSTPSQGQGKQLIRGTLTRLYTRAITPLGIALDIKMSASFSTSESILNDLAFLQTTSGFTAGLACIAALWIVLTILGRRKNIWRTIETATKKPLIFGLTAGLVIPILVEKLLEREKEINTLIDVRIQALIFIATLAIATIRLSKSWVKSEHLQSSPRLKDPKDQQTVINLVEHLAIPITGSIAVAAAITTLGAPLSIIAALTGGIGVGIGFSLQHVGNNFISGILIFLERPFRVGDLINIKGEKGIVQKIGWFHTKLMSSDRHPLYVPNLLFTKESLANPGQMSNRQIQAIVGLRYEDIHLIPRITEEIRTLLTSHKDIDQNQLIAVSFTEWNNSAARIKIKCFTITVKYIEWLEVQQAIFLAIAEIIKTSGADYSSNRLSIYPISNNLDKNSSLAV